MRSYDEVFEALKNQCDRAVDLIGRQQDQMDDLMHELDEQVRLNGMGSEREARLMARITELEKLLYEAEEEQADQD
jgi:hypothetical protein